MTEPDSPDADDARSLVGVGLGSTVAFWLGEGLLHVLVFRDGDAWVILWPSDAHDLLTRLLLAAVMLAFTAHAARGVRKKEALRRERESLHGELATALTHALSGFIPVCSGCKGIRADDGTWQSMEAYLHGRTDAEFTHGLCPGCRARLFPGLQHAAPERRTASRGTEADDR